MPKRYGWRTNMREWPSSSTRMMPKAHAMLARTCHLMGQQDLSVAEALRAVELNPFDAFANNIYGAMLGLASGDYEAAIPWFEKAHSLNPLDPQQYLYLTQQAFAELGAGRYEDGGRPWPPCSAQEHRILRIPDRPQVRARVSRTRRRLQGPRRRI